MTQRISDQVRELEDHLNDVGEVRDDLHAYIDHIWRIVTGVEEDAEGICPRDKYREVVTILTAGHREV